MTRAALLPALAALLLPLAASAQVSPARLIEIVERHCIKPFPGLAAYDLPTEDWLTIPARDAVRHAANLAIEKGIDYANFAIEGGGKLLTDPSEKWYSLTLEEYKDKLFDQRDYTLSDYKRLFVHVDSGAHLFVSAEIFPNDVAEGTYDPQDWGSTSCWLWHPDADHPLNAAITDRWGLPYGNRLPTPLGTLTRHYARADVDNFQMELQTVVLQPNPDFDRNLADTILRIRVTDRW